MKPVISTTCLTLLLVLAIGLLLMPMAQAQTFTVLHNFRRTGRGKSPAGLTIDRAGNLYGTAAGGGNSEGYCYDPSAGSGCGTVFKLSHHNSGWTFQSALCLLWAA